MKAFWKWMKERGYGDQGFLYAHVMAAHFYDKLCAVELDKKALTGYMLEYIRDHEWWDDPQKDQIIKGDMAMRIGLIWNCIKPFEEYESIIKEMDGEL
jgi:uncharacterized membrane protein